MPWVVTVKVTDCGNGVLLSGASMWDGSQTVFTDVNGQVIWYIDDSFVSYTIQISKTGYDSKTFAMVPAMNGTIQTVCLMVHLDTTCFTAGTRVTLTDGSEKPIELIRPGDHVLSRYGEANRVASIDRTRLGRRRLYAVGAGEPFVTAEHPFMTEAGWKSIDPAATAAENAALAVERLTVRDRLVVLVGCSVPAGNGGGTETVEPTLESIAVERIDSVAAPAETPLYNLLLTGDHSYFANGFLVHNKGTTGPSCFIVSATTGSSRSAEVTELRALRDRVAATSKLGARLIDAIYAEYFTFSPGIAAELEKDDFARKAVLWAVVRPLLAWYRLGGVLAFEPADHKAITRATRELAAACPKYLGSDSILAALDAIREGRPLSSASSMLREFEPALREAARLRYVSWAILDPLQRSWRSGSTEPELVAQVTDWLAKAPLESVARPATPVELDQELGALARLFAFSREGRRQVGERLARAWPEAKSELEVHDFA